MAKTTKTTRTTRPHRDGIPEDPGDRAGRQARISKTAHETMHRAILDALASGPAGISVQAAHTAATLALLDAEQILALVMEIPYEEVPQAASEELLAEQRKVAAPAVEAGRRAVHRDLGRGLSCEQALANGIAELFRVRRQRQEQAGMLGVPEGQTVQ